ncbi:hypothetical protein Pelo_18404 [Pelomyxa schiedti]|nr:hypothetical protein Pelo_18404 [Pelomyxa schiedti]
MWANEWVLRPAREAVFELPLHLGHGYKSKSENPVRWMKYYLYVSVSPTLAVVDSYWLTCDQRAQVCGCLGDGNLLCGVPCGTAFQCGVVSVRDPSVAIASLLSRVGNTKWSAGFEADTLSLMRVVEGVPREPVRKLPGMKRGTLQFSPLSDDVAMVFSAQYVTLVDLCASFNTDSLVVTGKIESIERNPYGLVWMPDGSICTLQVRSRGFPWGSIVDPKTCWTCLIPLNDSIPVLIGASHILTVDRENLRVYYTGDHVDQKLTTPSLSVPCTWASTKIVGSPSSHHLIASTSYVPSSSLGGGGVSGQQHVDFAVHDGVTGTRIAVIPIPLTPPCFFSASWYTMGQKHAHPQSQQRLHVIPSTTTTAKSQAMALLCAPVVAKRPSPLALPAPSLVQWAQSTALVRAWAREWVLRPAADAMFRLPIDGAHRLCASVSPTLGLVSAHWFRRRGAWASVCGGVGEGRVLVESIQQVKGGPALNLKDYYVVDVTGVAGGFDETTLVRVLAGLETRERFSMWSNRKWIVGLPSVAEMRVWKVGSGGLGGVKLSEEQRFKVVEASTLQFSPLCDDVIMVFSSQATAQLSRGCVEFVDLEASLRQRGQLVVRSRVECKYGIPSGILWMPDGSTSTLHYDYSEHLFLRETTTGEPLTQFPKFSNVVPVGPHHVFVTTRPVRTEFQVYSTGNLTTPSLCVPCTWASPSILPTGLIASTTHDKVKSCDATEIQVAVHDGATGFHVGDFSIPLSDPNAFNSAC